MKHTATITYDLRSDDGEREEGGYWLPGGWEFNIANEAVLAEARAGDYDLPLAQAIRSAIELGCTEVTITSFPASRRASVSACSVDPAHDRAFFEDGESRYYELHVQDISKGTAARVARLLKGRAL